MLEVLERPSGSSTGQPYFLLKDFNSRSDIVDKSGNNIPVTVGSDLGVGADNNGTYMQFKGTRQSYLECISTLMNRQEVEINYTVGSIITTGGAWGSIIIDTRPMGINGNYFTQSFVTRNPPPRIFESYLNGTTLTSTKSFSDSLHSVKIELKKTGTKFWVDNELVVDSTAAMLNFNNQHLKLGLHAWINQPGVFMFTGRIYYFSIKEII